MCTADYANIETIDMSSWQNQNPFDAAPLSAAIVAQSTGGGKKQFSSSNPDHQLPEPVGYDPSVSISVYNRELDEYISEVSSSR